MLLLGKFAMSPIRTLLSCVTFLMFICVQCVQANILAGVTIESYPFVQTKNNRFSGLCVELMDAIRKKTGLDYSLYLVEDGTYGPGSRQDGRISGLIKDVFEKKADFAVADMTVLPNRERYVKFTKPFFTFSVSGLVHKKNVKNLKTIDDLALKSNLDIGAFDGSNTLISMSLKKTVRNIRWLHERIIRNQSNIIRRNEDILQKVLNEKFVFLQEEPRNAFLASQNCNLTILRDPQYYFYGEYAIALPIDSQYLVPFNLAIERLEKEGFLEKLKSKYFLRDPCSMPTSSTFSIYSDFQGKTVLLYIFIFHTLVKRILF